MKYNVVITSGGTSEKIDNVRKITNSSSGKLGMTIANHLLQENNVENNNERDNVINSEVVQEYAEEILDIANEVRQQRILFQEDMTKVPEFDSLRIKIKKLELKIK